ncbi:hypothetical protein pb186bvf_018862 [Paramecium bursaria]
MLKNWFSKALDGIFGDIFEKMPNSQFELNKWQGVGENKNLRIKEQRIKYLFAFLGYDVEVVEATIGIFQFKIPWNRLWKEPSKIVIKDALIHIQTKGIFSQEFQSQYEQIIKQSLIQKLENKFMKKIDSQQGSYLKSLKNYFQEMIIIEIENLELKIEDKQVCLRNQSFTIKLGFQKLTIQPFTYDNQKKAQIFKFNTENLYCSFTTNDQVQDMIEPLSIMVNMIKYDDNITNKQINIQIDQFVMNINNLQFLALIRLNQLRNWSRQQGDHLKFRPQYNVRPKHDRRAWQEYFTNIAYMLKDRILNGNIRELKSSFIRRTEYLNIFLIYQLSIISDQKNFKLVLKNQEQIVDSSQILGLVKEYEQKMLFEEIQLQREKVYKIIQDEEQLKIKLQEYEYEQSNQSPTKKQSIISRLTYFWRRNNYQIEETKMEQLLNLLKSQQVQTEVVNISRTYSINFKKIIINYAIYNGNAHNFMSQEIYDMNFRYINNSERKEYKFGIQNILVYDKITQNKDYQLIFQPESRSKYQQFKQNRQIFEFSYISDVKKQINVQIQPIICCFNDTILVRLQSFIIKIQKGDQFILLINNNKKDKNKVTAKQWIKDLFEKDMIQIDLQMNGLIFILPENSARQKCNYLLFMIEQIKVQSIDKIQFDIQKLELLFVYYDEKKVSNINYSQKKEQMVEPLNLLFMIKRNFVDGIGYLEFDNTFSDIMIKVPLLYAEFLQNYIDNIITTWNNIIKIQNIEEDNCIDLRRKTSQARSYCSSIPRQDDVSSNNGSEKFYDADEYFNLDNHDMQSTLEKRELMINKWKKLENQFIYFIDKVYKKADPFIQTAIQLIDIKSLTKCQLIKIIVITDKYKEKITYFEVNQIALILNKCIKTTKFQVDVNLRDSCLSFYKLETIFKVYSYIHQYKHKLNRYLKKINLIPWLLKLQKLDIDFKISCDNHRILFQNSWNAINQDILIIVFKNIHIISNHPFSIRYKDLKINKPSFVKIDSFQMCNIVTNFSVYFKIKVQILNFTIKEYESLLDETSVDIQFSQTLAQQDITLKLNNLWINFSPSIVFSLQILNQYSIQLKEKLILGFEDQLYQLPKVINKSAIEKQQNFFEIVKQRYRLGIRQNSSFPKHSIQLELSELETEITNKTDLKDTIQHIIVNLTNQKLRLNVNGLSVGLMNQDSVDYLCDTIFKFQFCPRNQEYEYSKEICQNSQGTYYLRLMSRNMHKFYIYYLVNIIVQDNTIIYQIEQLSKAPYIIKNNTSGPITISQNQQLKHKIDIDVGNTESFCWDCPFTNRQLQIEIIHDTDRVKLNIEIDDFNNEELIIDKRIDKDLVQEYTIEVFQDEEERMRDVNYQKLIVINQKTANRIISKNWQLKISHFGISVCNKEEILFIYAKDLQYRLNQQEGQINYEITFEQGAIQNQTCFLPSYNFKMYNQAQKQNIKDQVFSSRLFRSIQQDQKDGFFYFQIIQKTQTEIMVHIQKVKLMLPSIKFKIDGNVVIKLFYFFKTLRDIRQKFQIDNHINEQRSFSQINRYIKPKAIHFDKITISPFKFDVKFRNLQGIEECCSELFPRVGLLIFVLNKINQYSYVFQPYKFKDIKLSTEGNHLRAIQDFNLFYLNRLKENFEKQAMFSQFIRFQDSLQREFDNGLDQMQNIFDEDTNGQDLQFKFQILNTAFKLGQTFVSQTQQTLGTFLEGTIKYFETSGGGNQNSFSSGLNKILTKVSHFHKKIFIKHQIFSFDKLFNKKKLKRYPKYFDWNYKLEQYDENKSKIQLYMQWRISQGTIFKKWYAHKLNDDIYLLISNSLFTVFNFDKNTIQLEINTNQIHSIENIQDTLIIIYEKGNQDDEGMQKLKIEKHKINNVKNNQIKKVLAEMQGQSQQIYLLQIME